MDKFSSIIEKAKHSTFYLWLLNTILLKTVPFNKPHGLKVTYIGEDSITIKARNKRYNQNHIKGVHACLLATLCEYISGLSLLVHLSPKDYRIILKNIHMTYHYQAKQDVEASFKLSAQQLQTDFVNPLKTAEAIFHEFTVEVYDIEKNHICTGLINWQIKAWKNVKMKL